MAPIVVLLIFASGILFNWIAKAQSPTVEWLQMQATAQAQRIQEIQTSSDAQASATRERLMAVETISKQHTEKLEEIAATERWIVFGVFGLLASQIFRRTFPGTDPPSNGSIVTLGTRITRK